MAGLSYGRAATRVAGLAGRVSEQLLAAEDDCAARVADRFGRTPSLPSLTLAGWRAAAPRRRLVEAAGQALADVQPMVAQLAGRAASLGLSSARDELQVLERALPKRYAGCAGVAADGAAGFAEDFAEARHDVFVAWEPVIAEQFGRDLRHQVGQARDVAELPARLFSPDPVSLRGLSGRGVWWRMSSQVVAAARDVSISTAGAVRSEAMRLFNQEAAGRG